MPHERYMSILCVVLLCSCLCAMSDVQHISVVDEDFIGSFERILAELEDSYVLVCVKQFYKHDVLKQNRKSDFFTWCPTHEH